MLDYILVIRKRLAQTSESESVRLADRRVTGMKHAALKYVS